MKKIFSIDVNGYISDDDNDDGSKPEDIKQQLEVLPISKVYHGTSYHTDYKKQEMNNYHKNTRNDHRKEWTEEETDGEEEETTPQNKSSSIRDDDDNNDNEDNEDNEDDEESKSDPSSSPSISKSPLTKKIEDHQYRVKKLAAEEQRLNDSGFNNKGDDYYNKSVSTSNQYQKNSQDESEKDDDWANTKNRNKKEKHQKKKSHHKSESNDDNRFDEEEEDDEEVFSTDVKKSTNLLSSLPDLTNMKVFLMNLIPKSCGLIQCYIRRNKSGVNQLYPVYSLYLKVIDNNSILHFISTNILYRKTINFLWQHENDQIIKHQII
jgi:hypothetical protein